MKLATLNFWGSAWPVSLDKEIRLARLVEFIKNEQPDVFAIQEIPADQDFQILLKQFSSYSFPKFEEFIFMSKFPIKSSQHFDFAPRPITFSSVFKKLTLQESMLQKGFQKVTITFGNQDISFLNIHLAYSKNLEIQKTQIEEVLKNVQGPSILLGDFNMDAKDLVLPAGFSVISEDKSPTLTTKNSYANTLLNKFHADSWACDLIISNFPVQVLEKKIIDNPLMSDHYPSVVKISF